MSVSSVSLTIQNAPRDPKPMLDAGRFQIRRLANEIGLFGDEAAKEAFMQLTPEGQAEAVCMKLKEIDTTGVMPASQPASQMQMTPPQAPMQGTPLMAPPQAAPPATSRRQPRTSTDAAAPAAGLDPAAAIVEHLKSIGAQLQQLSKQTEQANVIADKNQEKTAKVQELLNTLCSELEKLNPFLSGLTETMKGLMNLQYSSLALNLMLAEQVLNGNRNDILTEAFRDTLSIRGIVESLSSQGKFKG